MAAWSLLLSTPSSHFKGLAAHTLPVTATRMGTREKKDFKSVGDGES